jgi:hypothetical protein
VEAYEKSCDCRCFIGLFLFGKFRGWFVLGSLSLTGLCRWCYGKFGRGVFGAIFGETRLRRAASSHSGCGRGKVFRLGGDLQSRRRCFSQRSHRQGCRILRLLRTDSTDCSQSIVDGMEGGIPTRRSSRAERDFPHLPDGCRPQLRKAGSHQQSTAGTRTPKFGRGSNDEPPSGRRNYR